MRTQSFWLLWNKRSAFGTSAPLLWISGTLSCSYPSSLQICPKLLFSFSFLQQTCGSGVLADGRLADLIRRVSIFGMMLMKLDLRQVWFKVFAHYCLDNHLCPETSSVTGIWQTCWNTWCNYKVFGYGNIQWVGWRKETGLLNQRTEREEATGSI